MDLVYKVNDNKYYNIKDVLKGKFNISSRLYLKLRNSNQIYLNGVPDNTNKKLSLGDIVEVDLNFDEDNSNILSSKMDLQIVYEDKYMLILNKQAYIPVHPSMLHFEDSLSNGVKYYFDHINLHRKIRIVNRLDKDTTGIVIFAKNEYIQEALTLQMKNHTFVKEYIALLSRRIRKKVWYN